MLPPKIRKMCDPILVTLLKMRPHYSQSSHENATPSSGTSALAFKKIPPRVSHTGMCHPKIMVNFPGIQNENTINPYCAPRVCVCVVGAGGGRHSREVWLEVCRRCPQSPTLFKTKTSHFTTLSKTGDTTFRP